MAKTNITPPSGGPKPDGIPLAEASACCAQPLITIDGGKRMTCANCHAIHERNPANRDFWICSDQPQTA